VSACVHKEIRKEIIWIREEEKAKDRMNVERKNVKIKMGYRKKGRHKEVIKEIIKERKQGKLTRK
jgi:hypothetical protein